MAVISAYNFSKRTKLGNSQVRIMRNAPVGQGAYGRVLKCKIDHSKRPNSPSTSGVVKIINAGSKTSSYANEISIMEYFIHPNIMGHYVPFHIVSGIDPDSIESPREIDYNRTAYIVMKEGTSVDNIYHTTPEVIDNDFLRSIICDIASALDSLDKIGVIHNDVKLSNIIQMRDNRFVLTDFGASVLTGCTNEYKTRVMRGTREYVAPEVTTSASMHIMGTKYDIWSLGIMLLKLISKKSFLDQLRRAGSSETYLVPADPYRIMRDIDMIIDDPSSVQIDEQIKYIVKRCLQVDVRSRISAHDIIEYLGHDKPIPRLYETGSPRFDREFIFAQPSLITKVLLFMSTYSFNGVSKLLFLELFIKARMQSRDWTDELICAACLSIVGKLIGMPREAHQQVINISREAYSKTFDSDFNPMLTDKEIAERQIKEEKSRITMLQQIETKVFRKTEGRMLRNVKIYRDTIRSGSIVVDECFLNYQAFRQLFT